MTKKGAARKIDPEKIKASLKREENPNVGKRGYNKDGLPNVTPKTKGRVSKPTKIARESLALALEGCTDEIKSALKEVRYKDPKSYIECVVKLLPYVTPKLLAAQISEDKQTKIEINLTKDTSIDTLKNLLGEDDDSVEDVEFENL
tara:strand:- start:445 stop:882 length:438 start_codon:yes stop_codon:yes gene_type:complete